MKASELLKILSRYNDRILESNDVIIPIKLPFSTVGSRPSVLVENVSFGFDWDAGKLIIQPETPLTYSDDKEFQEKFMKLQERAGWLEYENRTLKNENKKLRDKIGENNV